MVTEAAGRYRRDVAIIKFDADKGTIDAPKGFKPTKDEQKQVRIGFRNTPPPKPCAVRLTPSKLAGVKRKGRRKALDVGDEGKTWFNFIDAAGDTVMIQERVEKKEGGKAYYPFTPHDDGEWYMVEPGGPLPLYGIEQLSRYSGVMLHEGARAARAARDAGPDHPWFEQLQNVAHIGWCSGAATPQRNDWAALSGAESVYIVADNDNVGRAAMPKISKRLRCPVTAIQFNDRFEAGFDLADPWPDNGPSFADCCSPASWATDPQKLPNGKPQKLPNGKPFYKLRDSFLNDWAYLDELELYTRLSTPGSTFTAPGLNRSIAPYSDVKDTVALLDQTRLGIYGSFAYQPGEGRLVTSNGSLCINAWTPPSIRANDSDYSPWLAFLAHLFPDASERKEVERWVATLIARPEVRMSYGLLLVSTATGVGKTTLSERVLLPLVGWQNVSVPSERDINSNFNSWVANKRLAIIHEVYAGASWKMSRALKSVATDSVVRVNRKNIPEYDSECCLHVVASSNSRLALKIEEHDRRWFYPRVTEKPLDTSRVFYAWLGAGGLGAILRWAQEYGDYVGPGDHSPMTELKQGLIEDSLPPEITEVKELAGLLANYADTAVLFPNDIKRWLAERIKDKGLCASRRTARRDGRGRGRLSIENAD